MNNGDIPTHQDLLDFFNRFISFASNRLSLFTDLISLRLENRQIFIQKENDVWIDGPNDSDALNIMFSDELKYHDYENDNPKFDLISEIKKKWELSSQTIRRIEQIIKDNLEESYGFHSVLEVIASTISEEKGGNCRDIYEILEDILSTNIYHDNPARVYIFGEYIHKKHLIVLYKNAIKLSADYQNKPILEEYEEVFIHELFHFLHYALYEYNEHEIEERKDYTARVVKESLAAYFEYKYCREHNIRSDAWGDAFENSVFVYPYSGAKEIWNWSIFVDVLKTSFTDMDNALRKLLSNNPKMFYRIKNSVEVITKK